MGDARPLRTFLYLEEIETGRRRYMVRKDSRPFLSEEIVDVRGVGLRVFDGVPLSYLPPTRIWFQSMLEAGFWQFVVELRSPDTTEIVKRAHAKFVVSTRIPLVIGAGGRDTEISADTTWTNDRIYAVRGQVFVNAGATLTIEPGTLVLAKGLGASIVVERGGRIVARGRPHAPIVMTCEEAVGQRFEGCWGGLRVLGNAPVARGTNLAEGIVPETRPLYGGHDPLDSSGVLRYVRVEFAGAGAPAAAGPAGLGFYGVGSGTRIDHVQARASAGDGILFSGGTANCMYCVSSGSTDDELAWALGWRGTAQHVFLQQGSAGGDRAIEGANDESGFGTLPRSAPRLYNLTLVGGSVPAPGYRSRGGGILLRAGSAVTVRNAVVMGFPSGAIDTQDDTLSLFNDRHEQLRERDLPWKRRQHAPRPGQRSRLAAGGFPGRGPQIGQRPLSGQPRSAPDARFPGAQGRDGCGSAIRWVAGHERPVCRGLRRLELARGVDLLRGRDRLRHEGTGEHG